ncbi:SpoIIE family protein phosphatase [Herbiconiux sp. CPCC 205716]|uniref:SpoIIE family protein phosphatase n=1 Tax=Herbiconiux gentiana TaxID=2970912 RepID=A0ABT2GFR8_9MICO|nr:GAF domain-containing SpoIIE family protein phosphatase [Herbiconiux gentiana]MCS5714135.1 SpoIIE family protein phosphatase [Herbiconiux gentiana]
MSSSSSSSSFGPSDAEDRRVASVAATGLLGTGPEERFDRITRLAQELLDAPMSYLNLVDDVSLVVKSPQVVGEPAPRFPYGTAFCEYTVHGVGVFEVPDAQADPRFAHTPAVTEFGVRSYAGVPLRAGDGEAVGTLCVMRPDPRTLSAAERARLAELGRWAEGELRAGAPGRSVPLDRSRGLRVDGVVSALSVPFGEVSGDLHSWRRDGSGLTVTVGDVMGKGVVAGGLAERLRASLDSPAGPASGSDSDPDSGPAAALARAARELEPRLAELGAFVTLFHARVDDSGRVDYVDAGHGLTVVVPAVPTAPVERLASRDLPLGVQDAASGWAMRSLQLQPGDTLLSVTDGVLELDDSTLDSLLRLAEDLRARSDVDGFLDGVAARVEVAGTDDDVTVLVVTVPPR